MADIKETQALKPGTILKSKERQYTVKRVLGAGGFGITYLASATIKIGATEHTVNFAIKEHFPAMYCYRGDDGCKVIPTPSAKKEVEESMADFLTEANRLKKICKKSRHIVKVNETFQDNDTAYYVMEYLEGGNPVMTTEAEAVEIIKQLAEGLKAIHKHQVLHLDIKPDNIMMKRDSEGDTFPVLIDFGVSKHFTSTGKPTNKLGAKGATEGYAPQEQYADNIQFSPRYDVYALGAVLLYLISGKNPPKAFSVSPKQKEIIDMLPKDTSDNVKNAILNAMKPNAHERTKDMDEFLADLNDHKKKGDTEILNPSMPERPVKKVWYWIKQNNLIVGAIAATLIIVATGLIINSQSSFVIGDSEGKATGAVLTEAPSNHLLANGDQLITINDSITFVMKPVDNGTFQMGAHAKQYTRAKIEEVPVHKVTVSDYYIGETEVTQALWEAVMGNNPSKTKGADYPVECVSWNECKEFIKRLNDITRLNFRLPTEAEWEFAARGGNKSQEYIFSGSDNVDDVAWYDNGNSNGLIHPVKTKMPNELGIYDMTGNVWEHCSDYFTSYSDKDAVNPTGPLTGTEYVRRGGSVTTDQPRLHTSFRGKIRENFHAEGVGLRLAIDNFDR